MMRRMSELPRLPLLPLSDVHRPALAAALRHAQVQLDVALAA
jgi:hypothetical protein